MEIRPGADAEGMLQHRGADGEQMIRHLCGVVDQEKPEYQRPQAYYTVYELSGAILCTIGWPLAVHSC